MPFKAEWLIEDQVIDMVVWGEAMPDQPQQFSQTILTLLEASPAEQVVLIIDDSEMEKAMSFFAHPKLSMLLNINAKDNKLINFMANVLIIKGHAQGFHYYNR